jgi:gliding motility-associated-like protein
MLNEQDKIKELFSEKLGNFEAPVNPALWKGVASQIGSTTTVAASGVTLLTKVIIGAVATTVIGVASYFVMKNNSVENVIEQKPLTSEQKPIESIDQTKERTTDLIQKSSGSTSDIDIQITPKPLVSEEFSVILEVADKIPAEVNPTYVQTQSGVEEEVKVKTQAPDKKIVNRNKPNEIIRSNNSVKEETKPALAKTASLDNVPNVFSPDGDRINDELFIEYTGELNDFSVIVLDKNNKTIYSSQDPNFSWNGIMMNGDLAPKGDYMYVITARDSNGNKINKYSTLAIR